MTTLPVCVECVETIEFVATYWTYDYILFGFLILLNFALQLFDVFELLDVSECLRHVLFNKSLDNLLFVIDET